MRSWDLWLDYHRRDGDGFTHGNVRNARVDLELVPGRYVVVGNEEADASVGEVVRIEDDGVVLVRVLPGSIDDNRAVRDLTARYHRCPSLSAGPGSRLPGLEAGGLIAQITST